MTVRRRVSCAASGSLRQTRGRTLMDSAQTEKVVSAAGKSNLPERSPARHACMAGRSSHLAPWPGRPRAWKPHAPTGSRRHARMDARTAVQSGASGSTTPLFQDRVARRRNLAVQPAITVHLESGEEVGLSRVSPRWRRARNCFGGSARSTTSNITGIIQAQTRIRSTPSIPRWCSAGSPTRQGRMAVRPSMARRRAGNSSARGNPIARWRKALWLELPEHSSVHDTRRNARERAYSCVARSAFDILRRLRKRSQSQ